jgi:nucleoside-diphosphate-sugar epimerase
MTRPSPRPLAAACAVLVLALVAGGVSTAAAPGPPAGSVVPGVAAPPQVLVFGGTGMIGGEIIRELRARGVPVTVFVRPSSNRARLAPYGVEFVTGDVADEASVAAALRARRFDVVVSAIARTDHDTPTRGVTIYATGNDRITAAARAAGVTQLIQVGTVGSGDSAVLVPPAIYEFARQVFEDKTRAEQTLVASGLRYTIVRTGVLLGGEPSGQGLLSEDHSLLAPMRVADIARETAACVAAPRCYDRIYHTVDPSLAGLTPEQVAAEKLKLRDLKAWRRQ